MTTEQMNQWAGVFGKNYTDRNTMTQAEMEALYKERPGRQLLPEYSPGYCYHCSHLRGMPGTFVCQL